MPKFKKDASELRVELSEQISALRSANNAYDSGELWQAKWIASTIYILCFDGRGRTRSLLGQLGLKKQLKFVSSFPSQPVAENITHAMATPLVAFSLQQGDPPIAEVYPKLEIARVIPGVSELLFSKWWEQVIFYPNFKINISRKNLVFHVRTKDGGGHVDDHHSDLNYRILKTIGDPGMRFGVDDEGNAWIGGGSGGQPIGNVVWPIIRQLGWELDETLKAASF